MFGKVWAWLVGRKTYIAGAASILYALSEYFVSGDMPRPEAAKMIETAVLGMTIRHGIATGLAQFIDAASQSLPSTWTAGKAALVPQAKQP